MLAALLTALLFSACSSTEITSSWTDEKSARRPFKDFLVIGISESETIRRSFESSFVASLRKTGVNAESSARELPGEQAAEKDAILKTVQQLGSDAVLITHLVGEQEREVYNPPRSYGPSPYYSGYYPYYSRVYDYVHEPGYYTRYKVVQLETNLYDVSTEEMVWSGRSESIASTSELKVIQEVIDAVIGELRKAGFVP
jgi:hypothetical protein